MEVGLFKGDKKMKKIMEQNLIFEDFIHDREVKMYRSNAQASDHPSYTLHVQIFTLDNLPFSPLTVISNTSFLTMLKPKLILLRLLELRGIFIIRLLKSMK